MKFLEKFWKGEIAPGEGRFHPNREHTKVVQTMERCDSILKSKLSEADYKTFREYADASLDASSAESCDSFVEGFRLGSLMMLDVLAECGS
jgi:hypothetical protein